MAENMLKYQCPACGGPVHFDVGTQMIVCEHCDRKYPKDIFNEQTSEETSDSAERVDWRVEGVVTEHEFMEEQAGFICTSCGAEVVSDGNTAATECMYCGNPIVLTDNVSGMVKPDLILPFKIDKEQAEKMLKSFYDKKLLLPSTFKDKNRIKKIAGMYVPFWLFSGKGGGFLHMDGRTSTTRRDGDYEVTTTKHYDVRRAGTVDFENIPVDASEKMEDNYMDGLEPYDYSGLEDFSPSYMAGYFADKFDVSVDDCARRAEIRVVNSTKNAMRDTVTGYSAEHEIGSDIRLVAEDVRYALLPVWMLNTKYNNKMYHFAINGQTGKVSGDLPIDIIKKRILQLVLTALAYIPLALIAYNIFS